ncbi:uncharacterized protein FIBRA_07147 [Fibroporia radiculosa]|uniref:Uncharacterized protein n=1 Tax=Fibroporia radiculosa TaxID=599839 RepID=J4GUF2_9APHY|nr:uncharacterized protein FIBRA_07147 [Fibroporia radiculosa]CCM04950.1 predicted protein [Fibroporia radiculosa]
MDSSSLTRIGIATGMTGKRTSERPTSTSSVPFPSSSSAEKTIPMHESGSSSSNDSTQTSSDKLSALPMQPSPALGRLRTQGRTARRSFDASGSAPSIDSPSASVHAVHHHSGPIRASESEGSLGKETPSQRPSLENDHTSLPATLQGIRQAIASRRIRRSVSTTRSPSPLSGEGSFQGHNTPQQAPTADARHGIHARGFSPRPGRETNTPTSHSPSPSRAASPLRRLGWALHRAHAREEPFVPVDPFRMNFFAFNGRKNTPDSRPREYDDGEVGCDGALANCLPLPVSFRSKSRNAKDEKGSQGSSWRAATDDIRIFLTDTLPRQAYLILLLGLPALYWTRVARVFEDAELSRPDVQRMIDAHFREPAFATAHERGMSEAASLRGRAVPHSHGVLLPFPEDWNPPAVSPALVRFKHSWELFVDSLLREWKTLNLVSALLCTCVLSISAPLKKRAILTMFQVNDAEDDPVTRSAALFGLIFALMSLSYGCVYIVQFGTMRSMDRASRWAEEAQKSKTAILWNIWVLLATPAIWLAWSMIAFCVSILSYVWRTGSVTDETAPSPLTERQAIAVRTAITAVFALGLLKFAMIIHSFRRYHGARRDRRGERERDDPRRGRDIVRERERRDGMDEARDRESKAGSASMVGLGLSGLENAPTSPGMASLDGVVREEVDLEKGEFLSAEKGRLWGRVSPKL